jgi:hypothetical protein
MKPLASTTRSPRRTAAIGIVAATLVVGATGAAYALAQSAAEPDTAVVAAGGPAAPAATETAEAVETPEVTDAPGVPGAEEYTQERSDAFWAAGYYMEDANALADLWQVPLLEAKGRAGQLLLDGQPVPVAPGSSLDLSDPSTVEMLGFEAYFDAGYTQEDGEKLAALWHVDVFEAKATAGHMLYEGQTLPVPPSGTPTS